MLTNPLPYGDDPYRPLNASPWRDMKRGKDLLCLVDADIFTYSAGFSIEHCEYMAYTPEGDLIGHWRGKAQYNKWLKKNPTVEHELDWYEWIEDVSKAHLIISRKRKQIRDVTHGAQQRWSLTKGSTLWRNEDATIQAYKGNRTAMKKPKYYEEIRQYMVDSCKAKIFKGMEADDSVASTARNNPGDVIICSGDKDLRTIAGLHLNPSKLKEGVEFVSELEACRFLYAQMLMGDSIDNIKGLSGNKEKPGWGVKKATSAMAQLICEGDMAEFVAEQYAKTHPDGCINIHDKHMTWQEMLVETANLLFLRRYQHTQFTWED